MREPRAVLVTGPRSALSERVERALISGGHPVHHLGRVAPQAGSPRISTRPSRAVLHAVLPADGGELREFRRLLAAQANELTRAMSSRAEILIVAERPGETGTGWFRSHRLERILTRMRAAAQQEIASTVTVNAVVVSGSVDERTVSLRICEAVRGRGLPDSDFVVADEDIRDHTLAEVIAEECR